MVRWAAAGEASRDVRPGDEEARDPGAEPEPAADPVPNAEPDEPVEAPRAEEPRSDGNPVADPAADRKSVV